MTDRGSPPAPWRIPLCVPNFDSREEDAVASVIRSRWLTMGPRTREFEERMAAYLGVRHAVLVANGTCALELAYGAILARRRDAGLGCAADQTIVVPDMTFVATANASLSAGARPVFADSRPGDNPLVCAEDAAALLGPDGPAPAALCIVHYAGFDATDAHLAQAAKTASATVVEDAAHAVGGRSKDGRMLGACGSIGCLSFFSNKNMATGEGGLVATDDDDYAAWIRLARSHGMTSLTYDRYAGRSTGYDVLAHGHNYRGSEITAALASVQLDKLDEANAKRRALYRRYATNLREAGGISVAFGTDDDAMSRSACHILPAVCADAVTRDRVRAALREAGIESSHHYPAVHTLAFYRQQLTAQPRKHWPNADRFSARELTLPLYPDLTADEVDEICELAARAAAGPVTAA